MSVLITIISSWLVINLLHGLWIGLRHWRWEATITRDANRLLPQAGPYTRGNGPIALLFVHGFADSPMLWSRMADYIQTRDNSFTCRAMRLPGSGDPLSVTRHVTLEQWRQAVDDEVATLRKTHAQVWLVSHSLGGALCIDAALRKPDAVEGLVLLAPLIQVSSKRIPLVPAELGFRCSEWVFLFSPVFESMFAWKPTAVEDSSFTYVRDRFIPFQTYRNLFQLIQANEEQAHNLKAPLFAALSRFDHVVDSKAASQWLEHAQGKKEIRWTETGHVIHLDTGWQKLTDDMILFIKTASKAE